MYLHVQARALLLGLPFRSLTCQGVYRAFTYPPTYAYVVDCAYLHRTFTAFRNKRARSLGGSEQTSLCERGSEVVI